MALIDIVKWDDTGDVLAWRFPNTELSTMTRVVVNESQEALLFKGGKLFDTFGPGTHTLSTDNIPILNKLINLPFGGKSPFSAEVWFVNRAVTLDVSWGTTDPIQVEDPKYGIIVPVRAFGQFGMRIADSGVFVTRLVGTTSSFSRDVLSSYFKGIVMARVKTAVSTSIVRRGVSVLEISTELQSLSEQVEAEIVPEVRPYGVELSVFRILSINVPADDESVKTLKQAMATAARRRIEGTSYPQERSFNVVEGAANNPGTAGGLVGSAVGLGVGFAAAKAVAGMMDNVTSQLSQPPLPVVEPGAKPASQQPPYFVLVDGHQTGPFPIATVQERISSGAVGGDTRIWRDGLAQWISAREVPELRPLFPPKPENS